MTDQTQPPNSPAQPVYQPASVQPAYAPAPVRPARPPLPKRMRTGSLVAGAIGFPLMTTGWTLLCVVVGLLLLGALVSAFVGWLRSRSDSIAASGFDDWLETIVFGSAPLLLGLLVVGVLVWLLGFFVSWIILKKTGNPRPGGTTWAGLGIAIVASWILGTLVSFVSPLFGIFGEQTAGWEELMVAVIVGSVFTIVTTAAVGAFSWWWMAHAMRPKAVAGA